MCYSYTATRVQLPSFNDTSYRTFTICIYSHAGDVMNTKGITCMTITHRPGRLVARMVSLVLNVSVCQHSRSKIMIGVALAQIVYPPEDIRSMALVTRSTSLETWLINYLCYEVYTIYVLMLQRSRHLSNRMLAHWYSYSILSMVLLSIKVLYMMDGFF